MHKGYTLEKKTMFETEGKNQRISRFSSPEEKSDLLEVIRDAISDVLWDEIYYVSSFEASFKDTTSTSEQVDVKEVDTSEGRQFNPNRPSRFRINFYLEDGFDTSTVYILSPAVSTDPTFATGVPVSTNDFLSYAGVKIVSGRVFLVAKPYGGGPEVTKSTNFSITGSTTNTLEFNYRPNQSTDVFYNKELIGTIKTPRISPNVPFYTFYPYLTSIKSNTGALVNITVESFEFLQPKQ